MYVIYMKAEEQKEKDAVDGTEAAVESRPLTDDTQPGADDTATTTTTPKTKKTLLGKKSFFRIFSPRRDMQKSLTMDADDRGAGAAFSVEAEGQVVASDTDWRSAKTASLDSKGRIPKSSTTGADRGDMVGVVADTATDTGRCAYESI